jgi:hypothetical protein
MEVFTSCIYVYVQFIQHPVGTNFETKEPIFLRLETMRNNYKAKHKANMKKEFQERKRAKKEAKQEAKQRAKEKVEEEKRTKEKAS